MNRRGRMESPSLEKKEERALIVHDGITAGGKVTAFSAYDLLTDLEVMTINSIRIKEAHHVL